MMKNFNMGALHDWQRVGAGEILDFPVPENGYRKVTFEVVCNGLISVHAISGDDVWLVAYGDGLLDVTFSTDRSVGVVLEAAPDVDIMMRTHLLSQLLPESLDPSWTTIEPRNAGPGDDLKRMMHIMRLNEQRRERELQEDRRRAREEHEALLESIASPKAPQAPDPQPDPKDPSDDS